MSQVNSSILVNISQAVGTITLNRPAVLNSLTRDMLSEFFSSITKLEKNPECRVIVITGAGRGFCAGQDLNDRKQSDATDSVIDLGESILECYAPLVEALVNCSKPTIAAVNGVAAGAGANIALACDFVVAKTSVKFIQAFCKIGLMPDSGGTYFLPRSIGTAKALGLCLLGEPLLATDAEQLGLIWQAVEEDQFEDAIYILAKKLSVAPTKALVTTRSAIRNQANTLSEQLLKEAAGQRELGLSQDYKEGVSAFLEKRPAHFSGN